MQSYLKKSNRNFDNIKRGGWEREKKERQRDKKENCLSPVSSVSLSLLAFKNTRAIFEENYSFKIIVFNLYDNDCVF